MNVSIGCAIWSYPGWRGEIYPAKTPAGEFLQIYSRTFNTVEVNSTFYAIPNEETLDRWRLQTPANFRFCPKFPRAITHQGLLEPCILQSRSFLDRMQRLQEKLGVIFIQLPPDYSPNNFTDLTAFLTALPTQEFRIVLEVRHLEWFAKKWHDRLAELLFKLGIGRVILDSRPIYFADRQFGEKVSCKKPQVPLEPTKTAPFSLIRYVSHPILAANRVWVTTPAVKR